MCVCIYELAIILLVSVPNFPYLVLIKIKKILAYQKTKSEITKSGSRSTLGPAIQFENLLPGNLCQSADLFRRWIIFTFHELIANPQKFWHYQVLVYLSATVFYWSELGHTQFHIIFLDFQILSWPFRQIGRIVNKHVLGVHFAGRWDCGPEAIRRPPSSLPFGHSASAQQCKHCDTATAATQSAKIVTNACEIDYHQKIMRNAKNTNYLTLTTIWQRLAGNLTILPRSSR